MTTVQSIQLFVVINLFVIGLSHFLRPQIWIEFFKFLHSKGNIGNIVNALIALGMGSIIVSFHIVWTWPMVLVTLYGISQVVKGLVYLTFPSVGLKSIGKVDGGAKKFRWVGLVMCLVCVLLMGELVNVGAFG